MGAWERVLSWLGVTKARRVSTLVAGSLKISAGVGDMPGGPIPGVGLHLDRIWHIQGPAHHEPGSLSSWDRDQNLRVRGTGPRGVVSVVGSC